MAPFHDEAAERAEQVPMDTSGRLCALHDIPDGGAVAVDDAPTGADNALILIRHGATVGAYLNVCPHAGRRLDYAPGQFLLKGGLLICAVHGATFQASDGLCVGGPCRGAHLRAVPVRVADGQVWRDEAAG